MSESPKFSLERDFWLKTEDYILRSKNYNTAQEIGAIVKLYSKVNPSQLFWQEIEQLIASKSSDFRNEPQVLL
jgi:hypothetical protein